MEQVGEESAVELLLTRSLVKPTPFFVALAGLAGLNGCELCHLRYVSRGRIGGGYVELSIQLYGCLFSP